MDILLSTTYFGPVQWYQLLHRADAVWMEAHESYLKQTYRNRCVIGSAAGPLPLTVPVVAASNTADRQPSAADRLITNVMVSDHGNWRHLHWQAITSAYRDTPFFDYYADDLRPFFFQRDWPTLWLLNKAVCQTVCRLLGICPQVTATETYQPAVSHCTDLRLAFSPKTTASAAPEPGPYWQPFLQRQGFMPGLSILDLLCCMGPEARLWL